MSNIIPDTISLVVRSFGQGGTDRVCVHLANGFARAGFGTEIVAISSGGDAEGALLPLLDEEVRVTFLHDRGRSGPPRSAELVAHLRRTRPACVVSTGNNVTWRVAAAFRKARLPGGRLVVKTTNPVLRPKDGALRRRYRRFAYGRAFRTASLVLTLSERETEELRRLYPALADRFRRAANPYVTPCMVAPGPVADCAGGKLVLAVGRLEPQKRMGLLIEAFARVRHPDARLVILGEGRERASLEERVRRLGLTGRVDLPGFVPDAPRWFRRADLFVLPSRYEGLPAVVLEALAANCPTIAADCFAGADELLCGLEGCAVLPAPDPDTVSRLIDDRLSRARPETLTPAALSYSVERAQADHVAAVREFLGR